MKYAWDISGTQQVVGQAVPTAGIGIAITGACQYKFNAAKIIDGDEHRDARHLCEGCRAFIQGWKWGGK